MKSHHFMLLGTLGFGCLGVTAAAFGPHPRTPAVSVVSVKAVATQLQVVASFKAGSWTSSLLDSASYAGVPAVSHTLSASATLDTILLPLPAATTTGTFSIRGVNGVGSSAPTTASWTYTYVPPVVTVPAAPTSITLAARTTGSQLWLVVGWGASTGATGYTDTLWLNQTPYTQLGGHSIGVASPDSFAVATPAATTPYYVCVRASNSAGASGCNYNSTSWTPPAPTAPTLDSLRVKAISFTVTGLQTRQFCAFGFFSNGAIQSQGTQCDSLGRALYNVRYSTLQPGVVDGIRLAVR